MSCDLTTLSAVKASLGITDLTYDTLLAEMIESVSKAISNYCDTNFCNATYVERVTYSDGYVEIKNIVQYVIGAKCCSGTAIEVTTPSEKSRITITDGKIRLLDLGSATIEIEILNTNSLSDIVTLIESEIGWGASLVVDDDYAKFLYTGSWGLNGDEIQIPYCSTEVSLSGVTSRLFQSSESCADGVIMYQGGYEVIPTDLASVATKMVVTSFNKRSKTDGLLKEKVGDYSYELSDSASGLSSESRSILASYCRLSI